MKKHLILLWLACLAAAPHLGAQEQDGSRTVRQAALPDAPPEAPRKKVGLVLSGGGAKGAAHVGVLRVLEEAAIPVDYIAGTSMGALVGGLYAVGYSATEIDSMMRSQDWNSLFRDRVSRTDQLVTERENTDRYILSIPLSRERRLKVPSGFVAGQNIYNLLSALTIGYHDSIRFDALPIPFACVAYDLAAGREVDIREGVLAEAIRSSISIPGVFTPVEVDSMVLVDGGVVNNFPVNLVRRMGAEIVIGSDVLVGMKDAEQLKSLPDMVEQFTAIIGRENYTANRAATDLYIHPDVTPYKAMNFSPEAIDTLMRRGEQAARSQWDAILALKEKIGPVQEGECIPIDCYHLPHEIRIGTISIQGVGSVDEKLIRSKLTLKENTRIRVSEIQRNLNALAGTSLFSNVTYQLGSHEPYDLTIYLTEASRNSLNLGVRFDSEEMAALLLNATLGSRTIRGPMFELTGRLSRNPYVQADFLIGNTFLGLAGLSYRFQHNNIDLYYEGGKQGNVTFGQHRADIHVTGTRLRNCEFTLGMQYEYFDYRDFLFSDESREITVNAQGLISYYFSALWETLDNRYYPTRGVMLLGRYSLNTDNFARYEGGAPFSAVGLHFNAAVSLGPRVALLPAFYGRVLIGSEVAFPMWNCFGGSVPGRYFAQQIPFIGVRNVEMAENSLVVARLDVRVRLWRKHYVSLLGNAGLESPELPDIFDGNQLIGGGLGYSFDSPIGPIGFILDYANRSHKVGFYFNLGRYF